MAYDHQSIEKKWQDRWTAEQPWRAREDSGKPKCYLLIEFPFLSGEGVHVGHLRSNTAMDIIARKRRMEGYEVLYPIGWDAFGLPTENYALKTGKHPIVITKENADNFRRQLQAMGFSFDWSREVNTSDPAYYKWTQWIFFQLLKHGLAYKAKVPINWCPKDKIGLANEEAAGGVCERCGGPVEKRDKEQWMLKITAYAEKLLAGLETVDYIERAKVQQVNWIGRSEGAEITFPLRGIPGQEDGKHTVTVFTTRPDTLFGATFLVVSPEIAKKWMDVGWQASDNVRAYVTRALSEREQDRLNAEREKTGVDAGIRAVNPANNEEIPVWIADYVLGAYGTGAIMAVPAHDERDWTFAWKYGLPVRQVIQSLESGYLVIEKSVSQDAAQQLSAFGTVTVEREMGNWGKFFRIRVPAEREQEFIAFLERSLLLVANDIGGGWYADSIGTSNVAVFNGAHFSVWQPDALEEYKAYGRQIKIPEQQLDITPRAYVGDGILVNSGKFTGMSSEDAKRAITEAVGGKMTVTYKLRDWVFSRQRYWGEPIPVVFCATCGTVPVPEDQLPVELPNVEKYQPTDTGESPLAVMTDWVNTKCPKCGGPAKRETDVMPNWAGSSWYFLRYCDPYNDHALADPEKLKYWMPVDWYNGGMEHTTLHLLYSRFWSIFLHDIGVVPVVEPYAKRTSHGLILASDGEKMSKSRGNVVNPDDIVAEYGADAVRLYEMFIGPFDQPVPWSTDGLIGCRRFLDRVAGLIARVDPRPTGACAIEDRNLHRTIKKVTEDIEAMRFNTAVSALMEYANALGKRDRIPFMEYVTFLALLFPFAPHLTEELHAQLPDPEAPAHVLATHPWPTHDPAFVVADEVDLVIQVNGKFRATLRVHAGITEDDARVVALADANVQKYLGGNAPRKVIYVPNRLLNIVV